MRKNLKDLEQSSFEENDSPEIPPPDIVAYNELRSCADLYRMYAQGILKIDPEFQREVVWKSPAQTRFIDSLVKQLPIPSMCFSLDYKSQEWQVIDGLQRMASIVKFLSGEPWILSRLDDIDPKLSGQPSSKFHDSKSVLHTYYRRVENLTLPITVIRCDYLKPSHTNYLFTIFHRLNTGGMKLNNQEIRNCIYSGVLNELLKELNRNQVWMRLNKMKKNVGYRFTKQELILRFFAFYDRHTKYGGRLAKFLNDYMGDNRNPDAEALNKKKVLFERTVDLVYAKIFDNKAPQKLTISLLEALLVGVAKNLDYLEPLPAPQLKSKFHKMQNHEEFSEQKLVEGLSGKPRVINRMTAAIEAFTKD